MNEEKGLTGRKLRDALRRRVVPEMKADEIEDLDNSMRLRRLKAVLIGLLGLVIAVCLFLAFRTISGSLQYQSYSVMWENEELGSADASYRYFQGNVVKVTMDGVTCMDTAGNVLWNYGYSMKSPDLVLQGKYGVIADIQANSAVIFNSEGVTGIASTTLPILNATVSSHGVAALVLNDTDVNYVTFYDNTGAELDIKIKTKLAGDGYPMDISLSPTGTGLVSSVAYVDQNQMQNQIVFYNFDVGQSDSNRMVGYFGCGSTMYPEVAYLTDKVVAAFGDDKLDLYSLRNETKPELIKSVEIEGEIFSVIHDESQLGIICKTEDTNRLLMVYDTSGKLQYSKEIPFDYTTAEFSNGHAVIYNDTQCMILSSGGHVRYNGTLDGSIQSLVITGENTCMVTSTQSVKRLKFRFVQ